MQLGIEGTRGQESGVRVLFLIPESLPLPFHIPN